MKKNTLKLLAIILLAPLSAFAQIENNAPLTIDKAFDSCMKMQQAVADHDTTALKEASKQFKEANVTSFPKITCDITEDSLKGHFVFDNVFVDSLLADSTAYSRADSLNKVTREATRGQNPDGSVFSRTCMVKAEGKVKYHFPSVGRQELAVVAEPGGLVAVRVHATSKESGLNEWYNDNKHAQKGARSFKTAFTLPDGMCTVEVEIRNRSKKDISFVLISN